MINLKKIEKTEDGRPDVFTRPDNMMPGWACAVCDEAERRGVPLPRCTCRKRGRACEGMRSIAKINKMI